MSGNRPTWVYGGPCRGLNVATNVSSPLWYNENTVCLCPSSFCTECQFPQVMGMSLIWAPLDYTWVLCPSRWLKVGPPGSFKVRAWPPDYRWELWLYPLLSRVRGAGDLSSTTNLWWHHESCLGNEALINTPQQWGLRLPGWWTCCIQGRASTSSEGTGVPALSNLPFHTCVSLCELVYLYPLQSTVIPNIVLCWVLWIVLVSYETWVGWGSPNSQWAGVASGQLGTLSSCGWCLGEGVAVAGSGWDRLITCSVCANSR